MSWATQRREHVIIAVAVVVLAIIAFGAYKIFHKTPTCFDHKKNQDELGVDCGGGCAILCASQVRVAPSAKFARALTPQPGRTDVVAYIDNPNPNAEARSAPFSIELFDTEGGLIRKGQVAVDLPPQSTVPVYYADVAPRGTTVARVFLTNIASSTVWTKPYAKLSLPRVDDVDRRDEGTAPRVTANLVNVLARPIYNTTLIATVFDEAGNVIAASQTFAPTLPAQGRVPLVFTWNEPFSAPVARVDVLPVPVLPR